MEIANSKLGIISKLYEEKEIRSIWDPIREDYFFSVLDVLKFLMGIDKPRRLLEQIKKKYKTRRKQSCK